MFRNLRGFRPFQVRRTIKRGAMQKFSFPSDYHMGPESQVNGSVLSFTRANASCKMEHIERLINEERQTQLSPLVCPGGKY
jgi:hypothetical protein